MQEYIIKGSTAERQMMKIIKEKKDGYDVLITRSREDWKTESREFISRQLFDICLRTNYLQEIRA